LFDYFLLSKKEKNLYWNNSIAERTGRIGIGNQS